MLRVNQIKQLKANNNSSTRELFILGVMMGTTFNQVSASGTSLLPFYFMGLLLCFHLSETYSVLQLERMLGRDKAGYNLSTSTLKKSRGESDSKGFNPQQ